MQTKYFSCWSEKLLQENCPNIWNKLSLGLDLSDLIRLKKQQSTAYLSFNQNGRLQLVHGLTNCFSSRFTLCEVDSVGFKLLKILGFWGCGVSVYTLWAWRTFSTHTERIKESGWWDFQILQPNQTVLLLPGSFKGGAIGVVEIYLVRLSLLVIINQSLKLIFRGNRLGRLRLIIRIGTYDMFLIRTFIKTRLLFRDPFYFTALVGVIPFYSSWKLQRKIMDVTSLLLRYTDEMNNGRNFDFPKSDFVVNLAGYFEFSLTQNEISDHWGQLKGQTPKMKGHFNTCLVVWEPMDINYAPRYPGREVNNC